MKILALIPARSGSKRIPNKNIARLHGFPLIYYTIKEAKLSQYINRIIVSTDSERIADIAKSYGAEAPFLRPESISKDTSTELELFNHALNWLKKNENYEPDLIVKLFPTSPFRTVVSIDECIRLKLTHPKADSVRSVKQVSEHPFKMWKIRNNRLIPIMKRPREAHTAAYQTLPKFYVNNASIDVTTPKVINKGSITGKNIIPYIMNAQESLDINTEEDFLMARLLMGDV